MIMVTTIQPKSEHWASGVVFNDGDYSYEKIFVTKIMTTKNMRNGHGSTYHVCDANGDKHVIIYLIDNHTVRALLTRNDVAIKSKVVGDFMLTRYGTVEITLDCTVYPITRNLLVTDNESYQVFYVLEHHGKGFLVICVQV